MTTYFTSDLHIGHRKVAELRGFESVEAHDEAILSQFDKLTHKDQVWVLGDLALSSAGHRLVLARLASCNASLRLVSGNHDPVSSVHRGAHLRQRHYLQVFESVQDFARVSVGPIQVLLSHFPYSGVGSEGHGVEERYTQYRLTDLGMPLLHGHTHLTWTTSRSEKGTPQVHVGLDAWGLKLASQTEVECILTLVFGLRKANT